MKTLISKIQEAAQAYYLGTPIMSDAEYDMLIDRLREMDPKHSLLKQVGADISTTPWPIVEHVRPMGSLHKVNAEDEYRKWADKYTSGLICVSEKLDGLSICLNYEDGILTQGLTRGDGIRGEDITTNIKKMKGVLTKLPGKYAEGKVSIRGEAILTLEDYKRHFPRKELPDGTVENSNPRNCVAVIRRKKDNSAVKHVTFIAYDIASDDPSYTKEEIFLELKTIGFNVPYYKVGNPDQVWNTFKEYQTEKRVTLPYEIDGLVAEDDDIANFHQLGESSGRPRAARALKFAAEVGKSILRDIVWQVGRTGMVTPVAKIDPVTIGGVAISSPSLMNIAECLRIAVHKDSNILVERCNDVIPRIIDAQGSNEPFMIPHVVDGYKVSIKVEDQLVPISQSVPMTRSGLSGLGIQVDAVSSISLFCDDPKHPMRVFRRLENFVQQLDIKGVGEKAIQSLISSGKLSSIPEYFDLSLGDWADAMGSETNARKVMKEFNAKTQGVSLPTFIKAMGMTFFGEDTAKLIESKYPNFDHWFDLKIQDILDIKGIGETKALYAIKGLAEHKQELLTVKRYIQTESTEVNENAVAVCFTGVRLEAGYEDAFRKAGYKEVSGVSKKTQILVVKSLNSSSSKAAKAKEYGTKIVPYEEFVKSL